MMRFAWPAEVLEEAEGITVTVPDVPGAITWGSTRAEALERAADALASVLAVLVEDGRRIPPPSADDGRPLIILPALDTAKLALHEAMLDAGMSNVELGRRMGLDEKAVRRMRDLLHRGHIGQIDAALRILGKRLEVLVREDA